MSKDYLKKEPTKAERMLYELAMHQEIMDRNLLSNSAHLLALGLILDVKAEKLADLLVNGDDKMKAYGNEINAAIDKLQKEKKPQASPEENKS